MSDFIFNQAKGSVGEWGKMAGANDAFIVIPIEATGVESDATLRDYDDVAALLGSTNNEQATMGRKTVTVGVTRTVDDVNDRVDVDMPDQTWTAVPAGNAIGDVFVAYDYDTTAGTDANLVPCGWYDIPSAPLTPSGGDITAVWNSAGFARNA